MLPHPHRDLQPILQTLEEAARAGRPVEMENFFSRLTLDIIGKAVFDYDFDSLAHDDPVIKVRGAFRLLASGLRVGCSVLTRLFAWFCCTAVRARDVSVASH